MASVEDRLDQLERENVEIKRRLATVKERVPDDDLVIALTNLVTLLRYGPSPEGGSFNMTEWAIAVDRARVFIDRMSKARGWDIKIKGK